MTVERTRNLLDVKFCLLLILRETTAADTAQGSDKSSFACDSLKKGGCRLACFIAF